MDDLEGSGQGKGDLAPAPTRQERKEANHPERHRPKFFRRRDQEGKSRLPVIATVALLAALASGRGPNLLLEEEKTIALQKVLAERQLR